MWYKMIQNCKMTPFGKNVRPTLGPIIFGTKCDRGKPCFLQKEGINKIELGIKRDPIGLENTKKGFNTGEV